MAAHNADFDQYFLDPETVDLSVDDVLEDVSWTPDSKRVGANGKPLQPRDRPLDFHWQVDKAAIERTGWKETGDKVYDRCVRSMMTAVALAGQAGDAGWVSISRRRDWYSGKQRYQGLPYSYRRIIQGVDELKDIGLIEEIRVKPQRPDDRLRKNKRKSVSRQSRIRATQRLLDAFAGVKFDYQAIEIIRLRDGNGDLMEYRETAQTRGMRAEVDGMNAGYARHTLTLPPECVPIGSHHVKVGDSIIRTTPIVSLYRVFNRGKWTKGGRLYWYGQNLPSAVRAKVQIDGEEVAELDYDHMHPRLAYALTGVPMPRGHNPYGAPGQQKAHMKAALLVGFNAKNRGECIGAVIKRVEEKTGEELSRQKAASVIRAAIEHNPGIRDFIGSDAGVDLMRIDSEIMIKVIKSCFAAGFPAYPIHDSVIVPKSRAAEAWAIMNREIEAFEASKMTEKKLGHNAFKPKANSSCVPTDGEGVSPALPVPPVPVRFVPPPVPACVPRCSDLSQRLSSDEIASRVSAANRSVYAREMSFARSCSGPRAKVVVPRLVDWSKRPSWKVPARGTVSVDLDEVKRRKAAAGHDGEYIPALGEMEATVYEFERSNEESIAFAELWGEGADVVQDHNELCVAFAMATGRDWIARINLTFEERVAGRLLRETV